MGAVADPEFYNGRGRADCRAPKFEFFLKRWVLVHSGMTFYVQKGIRKGIQDQQC